MMFLDAAKPGGIVIDRRGRRFANEATNYNDFGRALLDLDGADFAHGRVPSWLVFDAQRRRRVPPRLHVTAADRRHPGWSRAVAAELAERIGVRCRRARPRRSAGSTATQPRTPTHFGRGSYVWDRFSSGGGQMCRYGGPPYYAARLLPGCLGHEGRD